MNLSWILNKPGLSFKLSCALRYDLQPTKVQHVDTCLQYELLNFWDVSQKINEELAQKGDIHLLLRFVKPAIFASTFSPCVVCRAMPLLFQVRSCTKALTTHLCGYSATSWRSCCSLSNPIHSPLPLLACWMDYLCCLFHSLFSENELGWFNWSKKSLLICMNMSDNKQHSHEQLSEQVSWDDIP